MNVKGRNWIAVLAAVTSLLDEDASVIAVQGPPGSGKSFLAIKLAEAASKAGGRAQIVTASEDSQVGMDAMLDQRDQRRSASGGTGRPEVITIEDYWEQDLDHHVAADLVIFDDADTYEVRLPGRRQSQVVWIGALNSTPPAVAVRGEELTIQATRMPEQIAEIMRKVDYPGHLITGIVPGRKLLRHRDPAVRQGQDELTSAALSVDVDPPVHQTLLGECARVVDDLLGSWSLVDRHTEAARAVEVTDIAVSCLAAGRGRAANHPGAGRDGIDLTPSVLEDLAETRPAVLIVCCPIDDAYHLHRLMATCEVAVIVIAPITTTMPLVRYLQRATSTESGI